MPTLVTVDVPTFPICGITWVGECPYDKEGKGFHTCWDYKGHTLVHQCDCGEEYEGAKGP